MYRSRVEARRDLQLRANLIEERCRPDSVGRAEQDEVVALAPVPPNVAERRLPEPRLTLEIVDT